MTTHKHTAGPWYYRPDGATVEAQNEQGYNSQVADCGKSYVLDDETMKANARLIASAPALLAALEDAAFVLGECSVGAEKLADLFPVKLAKIRAAIDLATGNADSSPTADPRDAEIARLREALGICHDCLQSNFSESTSIEGRRALAAMNAARIAFGAP